MLGNKVVQFVYSVHNGEGVACTTVKWADNT